MPDNLLPELRPETGKGPGPRRSAVLLLAAVALMGSAGLHAQAVSFSGAQTTVPATGLDTPAGVAVDGAGNLFIANQGNSRVVKVPANGGAQTTVGTGLNAPYGPGCGWGGQPLHRGY